MDKMHVLSEADAAHGAEAQALELQLLESYQEGAEPLDKASAKKIIRKIKSISKEANGKIRVYLYNMEAREGYKALGFRSLRACVVKSFSDKAARSQLYREVAAFEIESLVAPDSSIGKIPEAVLREVAKLKDPEDQIKAWALAMEKTREISKKKKRHVSFLQPK